MEFRSDDTISLQKMSAWNDFVMEWVKLVQNHTELKKKHVTCINFMISVRFVWTQLTSVFVLVAILYVNFILCLMKQKAVKVHRK
jgi:hypothetical protein